MKRLFFNPLFLSVLAIIQIVVLGIVFLTWPPVTLRLVVTSTSLIDWDTVAKEFEDKHPNIRLDIQTGGDNSDALHDIYIKAITPTSSPYDLIYLDIIWIPEFAAKGLLMDLSQEISQTELAEFNLGDIEGSRFQNKLYRLPFHGDIGLLYYRKDLLNKFGYQPPKTFPELLEISESVQHKTGITWGYIWQSRVYEGLVAMFMEVLKGYGGFWIENGQVGLDQREALDAVGFLKMTIDRKISPDFERFSTDKKYLEKFQESKAVFLRSWPYVWTQANSINSPISSKIGFVSMVDSNNNVVGCRGGWGFGIAKATNHDREALKAIKFLTSEEIQRKFLLPKGYLPSRTSLFTAPEMVNTYKQDLPQIIKGIEQSILRPSLPQYQEASNILQRHLKDALTGEVTPEAAMEAAAEETRKLLQIK